MPGKSGLSSRELPHSSTTVPSISQNLLSVMKMCIGSWNDEDDWNDGGTKSPFRIGFRRAHSIMTLRCICCIRMLFHAPLYTGSCSIWDFFSEVSTWKTYVLYASLSLFIYAVANAFPIASWSCDEKSPSVPFRSSMHTSHLLLTHLSSCLKHSHRSAYPHALFASICRVYILTSSLISKSWTQLHDGSPIGCDEIRIRMQIKFI